MMPSDDRAQVATELALAIVIVIVAAASAGIILKSLFTQAQSSVLSQTNAVVDKTA